MLVIYPPIDADRLRQVQAAAGDLPVVNAASIREAQAAMPRATAFFGKITPDLLRTAHHLRWVQSPTASLEHFLFPQLVEHPCTLTNMRGLFGDVIADHVFAYVLCFARNLPQYLRQQQERRWEPIGGESTRTSFAQGPGVVTDIDRAHLHLSDQTLGVVGFGQIGQEIARRARAFGMSVLGVDVQPREPIEGMQEVWPVERLDDLLAGSDFVVVAAPHTPQTEGMFRREQFARMRRSAFFINIGRGAIVSLADLTDALRSGGIAGAGLDVFEVEPLPTDNPLWTLPNVILTPHVAAASPRVAERHLAVLVDNVRRFVAGEPLRNVADKVAWF